MSTEPMDGQQQQETAERFPSTLEALQIEQDHSRSGSFLDTLIQALFSGSDDPSDVWVRAGLSRAASKRYIRVLMNFETITEGFTDTNMTVKTMLWAEQGENRRAVSDLKSVLGGRAGGVLGGMGMRGRARQMEQGGDGQ